MLKYILLLLMPSFLLAQPLGDTGLEWDKRHTSAPFLENYSLIRGGQPLGYAVYLRKDNLLGAEAELQLYFVKGGLVSKALLILGPSGLSYENCSDKYKQVINFLTKKYGNYNTREIERDVIIQDLVFDSFCSSIKSGGKNIATTWINKDYKIVCTMLGGEGEIVIEIDYIKLNLLRQDKESEEKKVINSL